jgi:hypothetical protein
VGALGAAVEAARGLCLEAGDAVFEDADGGVCKACDPSVGWYIELPGKATCPP